MTTKQRIGRRLYSDKQNKDHAASINETINTNSIQDLLTVINQTCFQYQDCNVPITNGHRALQTTVLYKL